MGQVIQMHPMQRQAQEANKVIHHNFVEGQYAKYYFYRNAGNTPRSISRYFTQSEIDTFEPRYQNEGFGPEVA